MCLRYQDDRQASRHVDIVFEIPMMSGFDPTLTIQALADVSADAIVTGYRNKPGPLV